MLKLNRRTVLGAGAGLAAGATIARAQTTRWQMATPYPDGNFQTVNNRAFIKDLEEMSGGRLAVQMHSGASLLKMGEIKRGVQTGQVQLGEILLSAYGNEDPFFEVDGIPQLVTSYEQSAKLVELARPFYQARLDKGGIELLYIVPWPAQGFYTNEPLTDLAELKGTKFRTFSVMTNRFATLIGATPTLVQQAEVPQAFATGVVNAMLTSAQTGVDTQAWDFVRYFMPIGFSYTLNMTMVSRRALSALPADLQAKVREAAAIAETRGREASAKAMAATQQALADHGMTVQEPPRGILDQMDEICRTVTEEWIGRAGPDGRKLIDAYRAATGR